VPTLVASLDVADAAYDCVVVVTDSVVKLTGNLECLKQTVDSIKDVVLIATDVVPSGRVIWSPTGPLNRDYDDVRRFYDAGEVGMKRALKAGSRAPLFVRPIDDTFPEAGKCATLGALQAVYVPLEIREDVPDRATKVDKIGIWCDNLERVQKGIGVLNALEMGRDIGGTDPERMAAPKAEEYVTSVLKDTCIKVEVISDVAVFEKEYPLLAAVNRAARMVPRHQGRLIYLEYEGEGPIEKTLFLVGKGITYDTGGADIKAGGVMAGMHRDKCGAAFVAGFFKTLSVLKPKGVKIVGGLAMVRNSVGSECYVADEIITSRAGVRVRVGNTDAEGRMVMADVLCRMKERIIMDNGPARKLNTAQEFQKAGDLLADPFEVSTIRREYGNDSKTPLPYSHLDIAGSSGPFPGVPTGAPLLAMAAQYILPRV
ncbi:YH24-like protein, partial [Mya arenaria]